MRRSLVTGCVVGRSGLGPAINCPVSCQAHTNTCILAPERRPWTALPQAACARSWRCSRTLTRAHRPTRRQTCVALWSSGSQSRRSRCGARRRRVCGDRSMLASLATTRGAGGSTRDAGSHALCGRIVATRGRALRAARAGSSRRRAAAMHAERPRPSRAAARATRC